jgi:hypothetical protein
MMRRESAFSVAGEEDNMTDKDISLNLLLIWRISYHHWLWLLKAKIMRVKLMPMTNARERIFAIPPPKSRRKLPRQMHPLPSLFL